MLAILIAMHDTQAELRQHLDEAPASLVPGSLHPQDRVLLYRIGSNIIPKGLALRSNGKKLATALRSFREKLRERCIIYFPRGNAPIAIRKRSLTSM